MNEWAHHRRCGRASHRGAQPLDDPRGQISLHFAGKVPMSNVSWWLKSESLFVAKVRVKDNNQNKRDDFFLTF